MRILGCQLAIGMVALLFGGCGSATDTKGEKSSTEKSDSAEPKQESTVAKGSESETTEPETTEPEPETAAKDIVDTAVAADGFKTLVAAVKAAGLVDTLKGKGPFTVFAPTDAAFAKLPAGTLEALLKPENKAKFTGILT